MFHGIYLTTARVNVNLRYRDPGLSLDRVADYVEEDNHGNSQVSQEEALGTRTTTAIYWPLG